MRQKGWPATATPQRFIPIQLRHSSVQQQGCDVVHVGAGGTGFDQPSGLFQCVVESFSFSTAKASIPCSFRTCAVKPST